MLRRIECCKTKQFSANAHSPMFMAMVKSVNLKSNSWFSSSWNSNKISGSQAKRTLSESNIRFNWKQHPIQSNRYSTQMKLLVLYIFFASLYFIQFLICRLLRFRIVFLSFFLNPSMFETDFTRKVSSNSSAAYIFCFDFVFI